MTTWLTEFASYDMVPANTLGEHRATRHSTWHTPSGMHYNQIDYTLVQNRFRSGFNGAKARSFPGAVVGSIHDLPLRDSCVRLKKRRKPKKTRLKINLDPTIAESFQAIIGGKFATDEVAETMTTYIVMTETANKLLDKHR